MSIYRVERNQSSKIILELLITEDIIQLRTEEDATTILKEDAKGTNYPDITIKFIRNKPIQLNITPLSQLQHHERVKFKNKRSTMGTRSIKFTNDGGAFISIYVDPDNNASEKYKDRKELTSDYIDAARSFIADRLGVIKDLIYDKASYEDLKKAAAEYSKKSDKEKKNLIKEIPEVKR